MTPSTSQASRPLDRSASAKVIGGIILCAVIAFVIPWLPALGGSDRLNAGEATRKAASSFRDGRLDEAGPYLLLAVSLEPDNAQAHYMLGQTYERAGRRQKALEEYRLTVKLAPEDPAPRYNLAMLLISAGLPDEALVESEAALAGGLSAARFPLAAAYHKLNRWEEAAATYDRLLQDEGSIPLDWFTAHLGAGDLQWDRGQTQPALAHWRRAESLNPQHPGPRERLARPR